MTPAKVKERLDKLWEESIQFHKEARVFDVPWSVPYEFSAWADDFMWENYGQAEKFWDED